MFHNRQLNNRINKIHKRRLRLVYQDNKKLSFNDLLELDNSVTIHQRNLQTIPEEKRGKKIKVKKLKNDVTPEIMTEVF